VIRVTNMKSMFLGCASFNQPLNWDVSRHDEMENMFKNCTSFNSRLNWVHRLTREPENMFLNCPISLANRPQLRVVDAEQVHREAAKINYTKLIALFETKGIIKPVLTAGYAEYIKTTLSGMIEKVDPDSRPGVTTDLNNIMTQRLDGLKYEELSVLIKESILYALEYVKIQSREFQAMYVQAFTVDCVNAYEGSQMTCAGGALERLILSLIPACVGSDTTPFTELLAILTSDPRKLIPEYIFDWYKLHKKGGLLEFTVETKDERKQDLVQYLLNIYPDERVLIMENIELIANNVGYDDDDFLYGGRKVRKTRRKKANKKKK